MERQRVLRTSGFSAGAPMIARRAFAWLATVGALAATSFPALSQGSRKPFRIGVLVSSTVEQVLPYLHAFRDELRRLGYVEGRDIVLEFASAEGKRDRYQAIAAELVGRKVDVIYARGTEIAAAAKQATREIPIVALAGDLVGLGLADSLARPGGNLTGVESGSAEQVVKQLEWLTRLAPARSRVAMLGLRGHALGMRAVTIARAAAGSLGITLHHLPIDRIDELERAFDEMRRRGIEAVSVSSHPFFVPEMPRIVRNGIHHRIAVAFYYTQGAESGGLFALDNDLASLERRAAAYVDKILKGAAPAELPVEAATHFKLTINLKTAKALGLEIPETILNLADRVIE